MRAWFRILTPLTFALAPASALAHDPGLSTLTLHQVGARVQFSVIVNHADLAAERRASSPQCSAAGVLSVWLDGRELTPAGRCRLQDAEHTAFEGTFAVTQPVDLAVQFGWFHELPRGHRCFARFLDAQAVPIARAMLARGGGPLRARLGTPVSQAWVTFGLIAALAAALGLSWFAQRAGRRG